MNTVVVVFILFFVKFDSIHFIFKTDEYLELDNENKKALHIYDLAVSKYLTNVESLLTQTNSKN